MKLTTFSAAFDNYNEKLAALDEQQNLPEAAELSFRDKTKRILSAVGAQYGEDSSEHKQAGGTRQSKRKRADRQTPKRRRYLGLEGRRFERCRMHQKIHLQSRQLES